VWKVSQVRRRGSGKISSQNFGRPSKAFTRPPALPPGRDFGDSGAIASRPQLSGGPAYAPVPAPVQIVIGGGGFSSGGDSGSLIVVERGGDALRPVALLFAGGGGVTIANPIGEVLSAFGVSINCSSSP
jgi:hypothetical protein